MSGNGSEKGCFAPVLYRRSTGPKPGDLQRYATDEAEAAETFFGTCLRRALDVPKAGASTRVGDAETTFSNRTLSVL